MLELSPHVRRTHSLQETIDSYDAALGRMNTLNWWEQHIHREFSKSRDVYVELLDRHLKT